MLTAHPPSDTAEPHDAHALEEGATLIPWSRGRPAFQGGVISS